MVRLKTMLGHIQYDIVLDVLVELIQSPAILVHIRDATAAGIETMKNAFWGGAIVDALRKGSPPLSWQVPFYLFIGTRALL